MTPLDILPFFLLLFFVGAAIGYLIGHNHGVDIGHLKGAVLEHRASLKRIIWHKRDSFKLGQLVTVARMLNGEPPFPNPLRSTNERPLTATGVNSEPGGRQLGNHADPARKPFHHLSA